nr:CHASE2 domain-containing protein [Petrachloros mirabilis]
MQLSLDGQPPYLMDGGYLPAAPHLPGLYGQWLERYQQLGHPLRLDAPAQQQTNVSWPEDCRRAAQKLVYAFNKWLQSVPFQGVREKLLEQLSPSETIRILIQTPDRLLEKLPWHQWQLLERYPQAELALSAPAYERRMGSRSPTGQVQILAILGHSAGIDIQADRALLAALPGAQVTFLVEPHCQDLTDLLWAQPWDILFFAGHSTSQGRLATPPDSGSTDMSTEELSDPLAAPRDNLLALNSQDSLSVDQLRYALKQAVERGLQLAILNSCDGLGLAHDLTDLHIPQLIVMREPVPDVVAHAFLQYFLRAFAQGNSFYLAVREARERLQGLEDQFPCATWLPMICQNPAVMPPTWATLMGLCDISVFRVPQPSTKARPQRWQVGLKVLGASLIVSGLVLGGRFLGWLQPLELWAFDQTIQHRPLEDPDPRLLVVTITEADIQAQAQQNRGGTSLPDATLEQLLVKLAFARVIGLDVYRDFPVLPEYSALAQQLRQDHRILGICKSRDLEVDPVGVHPPPEVPAARLGFSDFLEDPDGILRRQILSMQPDPVSPCPVPFGFGTLAALHYLDTEGVDVTFEADQVRLGSVTVPYVRSRTGGYQTIDAGGSQLLLNYRALRSPQEIASHVTLSALLSGQVHPDMIRDRIVLIGVTANTLGDYWATPYGAGARQKVPGVLIQAHMASQLLSAALDQRPVLQTWPPRGEVVWIGLWAVAGGMVGVYGGASVRTLWVGSGGLLVLLGLCLWGMVQGVWLPLIPAVLAFGLTTLGTLSQHRQLNSGTQILPAKLEASLGTML